MVPVQQVHAGGDLFERNEWHGADEHAVEVSQGIRPVVHTRG